MNLLKRILDIFLAVLIMFIFVSMNFSQRIDVLTESYLVMKTKELTDTVRVQGNLGIQVYEAFLKELNASGGYYDVEMRHIRYLYEPVYDNEVFTGEIYVYSEENYTDEILEGLYMQGAYQFKKDDYFSVSVTSRPSSFGALAFKSLFGSSYSCRAESTGKIRDAVQGGDS